MNQSEAFKTVSAYFQKLINITGTYFLSDYVVKELYDYVDMSTYLVLMVELSQIEDLCKEHDLDLHDISQIVGNAFCMGLESQE